MNMTISMETPARVMLQSLVRAGWGPLGGYEWQGLRSTLTAIVFRSKRTGCDMTVWQVAQSAGLSEKWTSRCLYILEGLGLIHWQRGLIEEGKPKPGHIQIMKPALLDIVRQAWAAGRTAAAARRVTTQRRLALLKKQDAYIRRSHRPELSTDLNGIYAAAGAPAAAAMPVNTPSDPPDWAVGKEEPMNDKDCLLCDHGYIKESGNCPHCHRIQDSRSSEQERKPWTKERRKAWRNARARRNQQDLERLTAENRRRASEQWRSEHPGISGFDWLRQQCEKDRAGVRS